MREDFLKVLKANPVRAREADTALTSKLRERGFRMDGKHLRALQAPYLLSPNDVRELTRSGEFAFLRPGRFRWAGGIPGESRQQFLNDRSR